MAEQIAITITITPEAAAHVAELGMQAELDRMVQHACETIPGMLRLEVWLQPPYDTGAEPGVILDALLDEGQHQNVPNHERFDKWRIDTFSPDVNRHFTLFAYPGTNHAG